MIKIKHTLPELLAKSMTPENENQILTELSHKAVDVDALSHIFKLKVCEPHSVSETLLGIHIARVLCEAKNGSLTFKPAKMGLTTISVKAEDSVSRFLQKNFPIPAIEATLSLFQHEDHINVVIRKK